LRKQTCIEKVKREKARAQSTPAFVQVLYTVKSLTSTEQTSVAINKQSSAERNREMAYRQSAVIHHKQEAVASSESGFRQTKLYFKQEVKRKIGFV